MAWPAHSCDWWFTLPSSHPPTPARAVCPLWALLLPLLPLSGAGHPPTPSCWTGFLDFSRCEHRPQATALHSSSPGGDL